MFIKGIRPLLILERLEVLMVRPPIEALSLVQTDLTESIMLPLMGRNGPPPITRDFIDITDTMPPNHPFMDIPTATTMGLKLPLDIIIDLPDTPDILNSILAVLMAIIDVGITPMAQTPPTFSDITNITNTLTDIKSLDKSPHLPCLPLFRLFPIP